MDQTKHFTGANPALEGKEFESDKLTKGKNKNCYESDYKSDRKEPQELTGQCDTIRENMIQDLFQQVRHLFLVGC